jgi:hypothetical protein
MVQSNVFAERALQKIYSMYMWLNHYIKHIDRITMPNYNPYSMYMW